jgi:hypothetical protein
MPLRAGAAGLLATLALWPWPVGFAGAAAPCPPIAMEQTWAALFAPEGRELTPVQRRALENSGVIRGYPGALWPPSGPAPLTVGLVWIARPEAPQAIEMDADGDGVPEVVGIGDEAFGHTYRQPGQYPATIRVRDRHGEVQTYKSPVTVLTPEAFDAEIQGRWAALKAALQRRDLESALECVQVFARQRADRQLRAVLRGDIEQALPPIRFGEFGAAGAVYRSTRPPLGESRPLEVRFDADLDGVWRLAGFGLLGEGR